MNYNRPLSQLQLINDVCTSYHCWAYYTEDNGMHIGCIRQVPYPELPGEFVEYLGRTTDGVIALSNYRLFVRFKESFVNQPLGLIESVEYRDIFYIYVCCKDAHSFRYQRTVNALLFAIALIN